MKANQPTKWLFAVMALLVFVVSCKYYVDADFREDYTNMNEVIYEGPVKTPFFKVHFKNGEVAVMEDWKVNDSGDSIEGKTSLFNYNRALIKEGQQEFALDDVAIIETNQLEAIKSKDKGRIAGLAILTAVNVAIAVVCITNPKACFGSCPTFYTEGSDQLHSSSAEGFSSSIAPSLEMRDLDALNYTSVPGPFSITMKNEALETHLVNEVFIQAVPKKINDRIFADRRDNFYRCTQPISVNKAIKDRKDISREVRKMDELEYFSRTDSLDLFSKEEVYFSFENDDSSEKGLVLNFRQSLLTTYLLYSGISYMGNEFGNFFARLETEKKAREYLGKPFKKMGGIKVFVKNKAGAWEFVEEVSETGPIARNLSMVKLPAVAGENIELKLELTKGAWRIDYLGLTTIKEKVEPAKIPVSEIESINGEDYEPAVLNTDDKNYLVSLPGNEFRLHFDLPQNSEVEEYELFLSSKGYYLEWMRDEWLKEKDLVKLRKMLTLDKSTWREMAIEYKSVEEENEEVFWNSKYTQQE